jgi:hypothetical protein
MRATRTTLKRSLLFACLFPLLAHGLFLRASTPTNHPVLPLHTCPAASIVELTRTKTSTSSTSTKQWKQEMDAMIQTVSNSGGGFGIVKAKLRPESPVLVIHLKTPSKQPYRSPASHFFSCSDPRVNYPGLFTPGGDLGEWIIGLAALEAAQQSSLPIQQQDVTLMLSDYLNSMTDRHGKTIFYACTDDQALKKLANAAYVADPLNPASHRELGRLLELAALPENFGSKHLRRMMKDGEGYYVRPQLVKDCITAFMKIHLDKSNPLHSKTMLHSLPGGEEDATSSSTHSIPYLEVVRKQALSCKRELPMFDCTEYPCDGLAPVIFAQNFIEGSTSQGAVIVHRDDVNLYRAELSKFLFDNMRGGEVPENFGPESLLLGQINIGSIHADLTRKTVYSESSRYSVSFVKEKMGEEVDTAMDGDEGTNVGESEDAGEATNEVDEDEANTAGEPLPNF